jgi:hypothetical protein
VPTDGSCVEFPAPFYHNVSAFEPAFGTVCYRYLQVPSLPNSPLNALVRDE